MAFAHLYKLTILRVNDNKLRKVSDNAFGGNSLLFPNLCLVDFSRNQLQYFPVWLLDLPALVEVNLANNDIHFEGLYRAHVVGFTPDKQRLLATMALQNNQFVSLDIYRLTPYEFQLFILLTTAFKLEFGEVFHCDCLMYHLYACVHETPHCPFNQSLKYTTYLGRWKDFKCLTPTNVKGMSFVDVPAATFGCYEDVDGCPDFCRCWVRSSDDTVRVICSRRNLTQLPATVPDHTIELNYSCNSLTTLSRILPTYFGTIRILDLSHNNIKQLNGEIFLLTHPVAVLFLHGNKLTTLPPAVGTVKYLTHWGRHKMDAISQTTLSNAFSWTNMIEFRFKFHWSLFLRVQLTIFHHWFK